MIERLVEGTGRPGHRAAARLARAPPAGLSAGDGGGRGARLRPGRARSEPSYPSQPPASGRRHRPPPPPRRFGVRIAAIDDTHRRGSQPAPRTRGRQRPGGACRPAVHQVLATLGYGDAIGHEVLGIQRVLRAAGYESDIFVETADRRLEPLTRDYRELVDASAPGQPAAPPLLDRIEGVANRLRPARSDGAHLPQHHAARILRRRAPDARSAVLPRPAGAAAPTSTACDLALGDSEFNRQDLEALGFPRTAVLPVVPDFSHLDARAEPVRRRPVRRRLDEHPVRRPRDRQQEDRGPDPLLPRLSDRLQPAIPPAHRRRVQPVRALLRRR